MEFYNEQQKSLDRLLGSLNETERSYFKARLDKLQRNITLKREALKVPLTAEGKKKINEKRKDLLGDKLLDIDKIANIKKGIANTDLSGIVKHHHANVYNAIQKSVKANIKSVDAETAEKAILTRASTVFQRNGAQQAQAYLNSHDLENYEILPESTGEGLVLRNKSTGKVKVTFRGTIIPKELGEVVTSVGDIGTDLAVMSGFENETAQFKRADNLIEAVRGKYGNNLDEIIGYSLGGAKALTLGDKYGIDTTTFNPLVGKSHVQAQETSTNHNINRTTEDIPSLGTGLIDRDNVRVSSIYPLKSNIFNVKRHHDLENWIQRGRPRYSESHIQNLTNETLEQGAKIGEHEMLTDMLKYYEPREDARPPLPRFGQQRSPEEIARFKAYKEPSFTEWLHNFNRGGNGVDTNADGELLPTVRFSDKTTHGKLWKAIGGEFTPEEMDMFEQAGGEETNPNLSRDEINRTIAADEEGRAQIFNERLNQLNEAQIAMDEATNGGEIFPMRNEGQSVGFGASTAVGLLSGLASEGIVSGGEFVTGKKIDDSKDVRTGLTGGLGGYLAAQGIAKLAGTAAGGEELAAATAVGTASSIAGKETSKFIAKKGGGEFAQRTGGGAAAGGTAGLGAAVSAAALTGAEAGIPLDAETLGLASVVGASVGAGLGGIGYELGKIGIHI